MVVVPGVHDLLHQRRGFALEPVDVHAGVEQQGLPAELALVHEGQLIIRSASKCFGWKATERAKDCFDIEF